MPAAPRLQAICLVLERDGRYLLGKRAMWKPTAPGYWCPISGRIEPGETEEQACVREAQEEAAIAVRLVRKLGQIPTHDGRADLHWWLGEIIEGDPFPANDEHEEMRWFTVEELKTLSPAFQEDLEFIYEVDRELSRGRLS